MTVERFFGAVSFVIFHFVSSYGLKNEISREQWQFQGAQTRLDAAKGQASHDFQSNLFPKVNAASDAFLQEFFSSECDDVNSPPSLRLIQRSIGQLISGSDIRGRFVDHPQVGSMSAIAQEIRKSTLPALTPFAAHCLGYAYATFLTDTIPHKDEITICIGKDPRHHGLILADAFARGAEGVDNVRVAYTGLATTPSMFEFCRSSLCDGAVMVTASHLPEDRNGMKFFTCNGGLDKTNLAQVVSLAQRYSTALYDTSFIPPTSGPNAVYCSKWVDWMPVYARSLKRAMMNEVYGRQQNNDAKICRQTLKGLTIVLNAGNGSGVFFKQVLEDLGADVSRSIHTLPDSSFPGGIPNPESDSMIEETIKACQACNADLGIMLDTDADRCGLVAPRTMSFDGSSTQFEAVNRNRLIALMGVIYSKQSPGCSVVTCSVTSEGLSDFLENELGLRHVRYLKGYANVIKKARSLTESGEANAEVAIETSGHCALKENNYLDDGTYTAIKTLGLLARERVTNPKVSLLDLIRNLKEMGEVTELRMNLRDGTVETTHKMFDYLAFELEAACQLDSDWAVDTDNMEGIRIRIDDIGGFFMLRKSLHDPVLSLQVEAANRDAVIHKVIEPFLSICQSDSEISSALDFASLQSYLRS